MPEETPLILVIDDKDSLMDGGGWVRLCEKYEIPCEPVIRDTKEEILETIEGIFRDDDGLMFVGTVLDLIYRGQPRGGIELWEELEAKGLANRCGKLFVTTKIDSDEVVDFAESRGAMLNTRLPSEHKEMAFKRFLRQSGLLA